jgi:hypothetical protein
MAYSVLQGVQSPNAGQGLLDAFSTGQHIYAQGQQSQLRQQQISEGDYASALRKMQIANKLAKRAITLPPEGRMQLMRDYSGALQSVGFTQEDLASTPMDDAGLQNLIAQTDSVLSSVMPDQGMDVGTYNPRDYTTESWAEFSQTKDPSKLKRYESQQIVKIGGVDYLVDRSTGQRTPISSVDEVSTNVEQIKGAGERGKQNVRSETEPQIQADIARARELATAEAQKQIGQQGQLGKLDDATNIYNRLRDSDLEIIYGRGEQWYPDFLRSQRGIDLIADRDQLVNMLKLGAAGELKGQGTITDAERKMLADAATQLGNPNISPPKARQALDEAMKVLTRNTGGQFQGVNQQSTGGETAAQRLARLRGGN